MPINFDTSAIKAFDTYRTTAMDANTNIQKKDGALRTGGTGVGFFAALGRGSEAKAANNAARTDFLASLGRAYKIEGMKVEAGRTTFSRGFMDQLEKILGPDFKRADYGLDADGRVASGKPLTARRVKAVLTKAIVGGDMAFSAADYHVKLDAVLADIAARSKKGEDMSDVRERFGVVQNALAFLKDELPVLLDDNFEYDDKADEDAPAAARCPFTVRIESGNGAVEQKPVSSKETVFGYLRDARGFILHYENFNTGVMDANFAKAARAYISNVLEAYVKMAVDLYLGTKGTDNFKAFKGEFTASAICMEAKTTKLQEFKMNRHIGTEEMEAKADGARPADDVPPADHDEKTELLECISREIQQIENAKPGEKSWEEDYMPVLERHLVGLNRPVGGTLQPVTREAIEALRGDVSEAIFGDRDML